MMSLPREFNMALLVDAYASAVSLDIRMGMYDLTNLKNGSTSQVIIYFSDVLPFLSNASIALFASLMACKGRKKKVLKT